MEGLQITFYQFPALSQTQHNDFVKEMKSSPHDHRYITYGEFDRLSFSRIEEFSRIRDVPDVVKKWQGKWQAITLLSQNNSNTSLIHQPNTNKAEWCFNFRNGTNDHIVQIADRFIIVSMLSITNEISEMVTDYCKFNRSFVSSLRSWIEAITKILRINCKFEVYGSLHASEYTIIWFANQYSGVMRVMDHIKHLTVQIKNCSQNVKVGIPLIFRTNSIIAYDDTVSLNEDVVGNGTLKIALKEHSTNNQELWEYLEEIKNICGGAKLVFTAGEYDVELHAKANDLYRLFSRFQPLHYENSKYTKYVLRTKLTLSIDHELSDSNTQDQIQHINAREDICGLGDNLRASQDDEEKWKIDSQNSYKLIRAQLQARFLRNAGAVDTIDLIYSDLQSSAITTYNTVWRKDFRYQFNIYLKIMQVLCERYLDVASPEFGRQFHEELTALFDDLSEQLYHLSQSNVYMIDMPRSHVHYTGQYDFIMHAYYGIVKSIISVMYSRKSCDKQSVIAPIISVGFVPIIKSIMHLQGGNAGDPRLVNVCLPATVLFDLPRGTSLLFHELFHYRAVPNRQERNRLVGSIAFTECILRLWYEELTMSIKRGIDKAIADADTSSGDLQKEYQIPWEHIRDTVDDNVKCLLFAQRVDVWKIVNQYYSVIEEVLHEYVAELNPNETADEIIEKERTFFWFSKAFIGAIDKLFICTDTHGRISSKTKELLYDPCAKQAEKGILLQLKKMTDIPQKLVDLSDILDAPKRQAVVQQVYEIYAAPIRALASGIPLVQTHKTWTHDDLRSLHDTVILPFKEIMPDISMIMYLKVSIVDYLLLFVQIQNDLRNEPLLEETIADQEINGDIMRIGVVLTYYATKGEFAVSEPREIDSAFDKIGSQFISNYLAVYVTDKSSSQKINETVQNARAWLTYIYNLHVEFMSRYNCYLDLFRQYFFHLEKSSCPNDERIKSLISRFRTHIDKSSALRYQYAKAFNYEVDRNYRNNQFGNNYKEYCKKQFQLNCDMLYEFQCQPTLGDILPNKADEAHVINFDIRLNLGEKSRSAFEDSCWEIRIDSLSALIEQLDMVSRRLKHMQSDFSQELPQKAIVWYRGQRDSAFSLEPSIMREYRRSNAYKTMTLREYQRKLFEEFKFRADGAHEMYSGYTYTMSDYIALMQHYSVPSNFLDWSEDAFSALYFALEPELDENKFPDKKGTEASSRDAVLYVFDPIRYNDYRKKQCRINKQYRHFLSTGHGSSRLPNLSCEDNAEVFSDFLLGSANEKQRERLLKRIPSMALPLAILTSKRNERIRAQSGIFLAYNIHNLADGIDKGRFVNNNIEVINASLSPTNYFLYKLVINHNTRKSIAGWLRAMGISKERIYPELENIGLRIK